MKANWIAILAYLCFLPLTSEAQWNVGIEYNTTFPFSDYGEVFKTGSNFNIEANYHLNKGWAVGFQVGATIFSNPKDDTFEKNDPKLVVVPFICNVEYEARHEGMIRPFFAAGVGVSIHTFSYFAVYDESETNASFTMSPQIGVRCFVAKNTIWYLSGSYVFVADGLPIVSHPYLPYTIFPVSDEASGYAGIALGFSYRFSK
jgi:hypothetical protein